jgi:hypothetical protein
MARISDPFFVFLLFIQPQGSFNLTLRALVHSWGKVKTYRTRIKFTPVQYSSSNNLGKFLFLRGMVTAKDFECFQSILMAKVRRQAISALYLISCLSPGPPCEI